MSSAATGSSAATTAAVSSPGASSERLRQHLEINPLKFNLKTGNAKWQCTLMHRNSYKRQRATRTDSSSSSSSGSSASSIGSK